MTVINLKEEREAAEEKVRLQIIAEMMKDPYWLQEENFQRLHGLKPKAPDNVVPFKRPTQ